MNRLLRVLGLSVCSLILAAASVFSAAAMQSPDTSDAGTYEVPASDSVFVPEGLEATLWAESPLMYNPTNIDIDAEGRVWVLEAVDYRNFRNEPEEHLSHPQGERVMILEDTDGDGKADDSKVFVQDEDLVAPLGLAVVGNKVYVSASPHLYVYTDTDGDDKSDRRQTFLTGFGGLDHDHGLHAITVGPDGRYYFNAGNAGPHVVTDSSGWTLRAGSIYSGGTPYMEGNQPGMVSDDGRIWVGGIQLRINPDGTGLEVLGDNFRNAYEVTTDSYGNIWNNDNDDDGNAGTRVVYTMKGGSHGYFSADGSRRWQADRRPDQTTFQAHWHQEDPGVIPAGDSTGPGAPTGIVRYESDQLGKEFRGVLLSADAGRNVIYGYHPEADGAGFRLDRSNFLSTLPESMLSEQSTYKARAEEDRRWWFRPSDVAVGTDGAIYVADWYDPRVGGHQMLETEGYGRIYRITPANRDLETPEIDLETTEGQIKALLNPAKNVRYLGFSRLREQGSAVRDEVREILRSDNNPFHRARAIWLLAQLGSEGVEDVEQLFQDSDPQVRVTAFRALRQVQEQEAVLEYARQLASDPSPAVRREVAIFLRDVPLDRSRQIMVDLAERYESGDRWELEALGLAAEDEESEVYELLKSELGSADPAGWSDEWADLVWRLHPVEAVDALKQRAMSTEVDWAAQKQSMVALGFINDQRALQAMEELAGSSQDRVAQRAQWWLGYRRTNEWHDLKDWQAEARDPGDQARIERLQEFQSRVVDSEASIRERTAAADSMAASAEGGRRLVSLVVKEELSGALRDSLQTILQENPDQTVRVLAAHYLGRPSDETFSAENVVNMESDAQHGRMVFYTKCASCHRVGQTGADVGPQLTEIKNMFNPQGLVSAILRPDAGISHGYSPWQIETTDGNVTYGFLMAQNESTIVIKDAGGRRHVIDRNRVASRQPLEVSLMPDPVELQLSEQEVADLTEFLMTVEN